MRKKVESHLNPADPPRRRANKRRGRGTFSNDRPPIVGTVGRQSGQVRLRVTRDTRQVTLKAHVERFTGQGTHIYTDEYDSYNTVRHTRSRARQSVMVLVSGHAMMTAMASVRLTPTRLKGCGPTCAPSMASASTT